MHRLYEAILGGITIGIVSYLSARYTNIPQRIMNAALIASALIIIEYIRKRQKIKE